MSSLPAIPSIPDSCVDFGGRGLTRDIDSGVSGCRPDRVRKVDSRRFGICPGIESDDIEVLVDPDGAECLRWEYPLPPPSSSDICGLCAIIGDRSAPNFPEKKSRSGGNQKLSTRPRSSASSSLLGRTNRPRPLFRCISTADFDLIPGCFDSRVLWRFCVISLPARDSADCT